MKKLLMSLLSLFLFVGCTNSSPITEVKIQEIGMSSYIDYNNNDFELLAVNNENIYINGLDVIQTPFLFTIRSLVILDQNGKLKKSMKSILIKELLILQNIVVKHIILIL